MWESLGFIVLFAYSSFLCTSVKLYVMLAISFVSIICYGILECIVSMQDSIVTLLPRV